MYIDIDLWKSFGGENNCHNCHNCHKYIFAEITEQMALDAKIGKIIYTLKYPQVNWEFRLRKVGIYLA